MAVLLLDFANINIVVVLVVGRGGDRDGESKVGAGAVAGGNTQGSPSQVSATTSLLLPPLPPAISLIPYLQQSRHVSSGVLTSQIIK